MGLLSSIVTGPLTGPIKGLLWIVQTIAKHADRELYDEDNIRRNLLKLEHEYELGKMTLEEFENSESELLQRLNQTRRIKEGR